MPNAPKALFSLATGLMLCLLFAAAPASARGGGDDDTQLALRVSDAVGQPGGILNVHSRLVP